MIKTVDFLWRAETDAKANGERCVLQRRRAHGSDAVTVREITPAGQVTTLVDPRTNQAPQTDGSTIIPTDGASDLYLFTTQASSGASVLTQVTPMGAVNTIALTTSAGTPVGLINPSGVTVDGANNVYIADDSNREVRARCTKLRSMA